DGVHAGAVAVVGTDAAVAITVQGGGIAAGPTVPFAGDQIDERRFLGLLHVSLSLLGRWGAARGLGDGILTDPRGRGVFESIRGEIPTAKREKPVTRAVFGRDSGSPWLADGRRRSADAAAA